MNKVKLPQPLELNRFCPDCANPLEEIPCEDPLSICLACKSDHRFFIIPKVMPFTLDQTKSVGAKLSAVKIPDSINKSFESIASFWLLQIEYRDYLNVQLAEMLRAILDRIRHKRKIQEPLHFRWCPICKSELLEFNQMDVWVQGLKCSQEHTFYLRGGWLRGTIAGTEIILTYSYSRSNRFNSR